MQFKLVSILASATLAAAIALPFAPPLSDPKLPDPFGAPPPAGSPLPPPPSDVPPPSSTLSTPPPAKTGNVDHPTTPSDVESHVQARDLDLPTRPEGAPPPAGSPPPPPSDVPPPSTTPSTPPPAQTGNDKHPTTPSDVENHV